MPPTSRAGPWLPMGRGAMAATILAADKDLLHPARRPVGVEGQVLETQEVTQPLLSVHRQEQAGVVRGEQGRVNALEPRPGERERLRQLSGQVCGRIGVAGRGVPAASRGRRRAPARGRGVVRSARPPPPPPPPPPLFSPAVPRVKTSQA